MRNVHKAIYVKDYTAVKRTGILMLFLKRKPNLIGCNKNQTIDSSSDWLSYLAEIESFGVDCKVEIFWTK